MELHYVENKNIVGSRANYICVAICVYNQFGTDRIDIEWNKTRHAENVTCKRCLKVMLGRGIISTELYCQLMKKESVE